MSTATYKVSSILFSLSVGMLLCSINRSNLQSLPRQRVIAPPKNPTSPTKPENCKWIRVLSIYIGNIFHEGFVVFFDISRVGDYLPSPSRNRAQVFAHASVSSLPL